MANATVLDPNSPGGQQQQQQADSLGMSLQQYQALVAQYPPVYQANSQGGQYGMSAGGSYGQNPALPGVLAALQVANANKPAPTPQASTPGGVNQDPTYGAVNLGASALSKAGFGGANGGFAVYNPTPGQVPQSGSSSFGKSGVSQVAGPVTSSEVPAYQDSGPGIFNANPSVPAASGGTPVPTRPPNAPGATAPATPWATAPAAPGASAAAGTPPAAPSLEDHTQGLINAGKALYSHFGGDPDTATHQDIMGFHNSLISSLQNATAGVAAPFGAAPAAAQNYTAGIPAGISAAGPPAAPGASPANPIKMATGGTVPDVYPPGDPRNDLDSVYLKATPGERVVPRQMGQPASNAQSSSDTGTPLPASQQETPSQSQSQAPQQGDKDYWSKLLSQVQQAQASNAPSAIADTPSVAPSYDVASDPDPDWQYTGQESAAGATGAGGGAAGGVAAGAGVASSLIGALQTAVDTYAKSIKPWQTQAQAFGKSGTPNYQATNFQQETA